MKLIGGLQSRDAERMAFLANILGMNKPEPKSFLLIYFFFCNIFIAEVGILYLKIQVLLVFVCSFVLVLAFRKQEIEMVGTLKV